LKDVAHIVAGCVAGISMSGVVVLGPPFDLAGAEAASSPQGVERAFGFRAGEERRYVLGPAESLMDGESATWRIVFEELRGDPPLAVFKIEHARKRPISPLSAPPRGSVVEMFLDGTLSVNSFGFPVDLVFTVREQLYGLGEDIYTIRYSYAAGSFIKEVWTYDKDWSIGTPIANHPRLDRFLASGLFVFLPSALHCMGGVGKGDRASPGEAIRAACEESDPAFANPGLLSIVLASWLDSGDEELDALLFTPLGPDVYPGLRPNVAVGSARSGSAGGISAGIAGRWMDGDIDRLLDLRRYYEPARVRVAGETSIDVGRRTLQVVQLEMSGPLREIYADLEGRVVRVNIDPHPISKRSRWIRLLFPSEY